MSTTAAADQRPTAAAATATAAAKASTTTVVAVAADKAAAPPPRKALPESLHNIPLCEVFLRVWLRRARLVAKHLTPFPLVDESQLSQVFQDMEDIQAGKKTTSSNGTLFRASIHLGTMSHLPDAILQCVCRHVQQNKAHAATLGTSRLGTMLQEDSAASADGSLGSPPVTPQSLPTVGVLLKTSNQRQHHDDIYYEALVHSTIMWLDDVCPRFLPQMWAWFGAVPSVAAPVWQSLSDATMARDHFQEVASSTVTYRDKAAAPDKGPADKGPAADPAAADGGPEAPPKLKWYMCMEPVQPGISLSKYCLEQCTGFDDFLQLWYMVLAFLSVAQGVLDPRVGKPLRFTHYDLHSSNILLRRAAPVGSAAARSPSPSPVSVSDASSASASSADDDLVPHTWVFQFPPPVGETAPEIIAVQHVYNICLIDFARAHVDADILRDQESQRLQYVGTPWSEHLRRTWHTPERQYGVAPYRFHPCHDTVKVFYSCVRFLEKNPRFKDPHSLDAEKLNLLKAKFEREFPEVRTQPLDKRGHLCHTQLSATGNFTTPWHILQWCRQQWNVECPIPSRGDPAATIIDLKNRLDPNDMWYASPPNPDVAMWEEAARKFEANQQRTQRAASNKASSKASRRRATAPEAAAAAAGAPLKVVRAGPEDPSHRQRQRR